MNTAVIFEAFAAEKHPSRIWFYEAVVGVSAAKRELPVCCVQQDETIVAPSFDAAWGNEDMKTLTLLLSSRKSSINTAIRSVRRNSQS